MATAALSAGDLTNARAGSDTVKRHLSVIPLSQVATADLNQTGFTFPHDTLTVDNASAGWTTDVLPGMLVYIGTGGTGTSDIGIYRVRETPASGTELKIAESTIYDPGLLALADYTHIINNANLTVYEDFNLWSVFPKISYSGGVDARSGTFYKDLDDAYTTQNETTPSFIGNLGSHYAGWVDTTTNVYTVAFSISTEVFASSVSTYLWDMDGGTITVGTTASQNPTATFPQGEYLVSCTITLANGVSETFRRWVIAHNAANPPLNVEVQSDRRDMTGRKMRFRMTDAIGNLEKGMMAIYWEEASWNGNDIASASTKFVGWLRTLGDSSRPLLTDRSFEMVSAFDIMKERVAFGQQLVVKSDPANWQEVTESLCHLDYWVFYLLRYHTTLLTLFDLVTSGLSSFTTQAWSVDRGNIVDQVNHSARRLNCNVGQRSDGAIYISRDPQFMSSSDRSAVIERMTITESDFTTIDFSEGLYPTIGQVEASGFSWDGNELTALLGIAPGFVGGQGSRSEGLQNQLVSDLSDLLARAAHAYAKVNNPYQDVQFVVPHNYDFFEPVEQYYTRLTIAAAYMPDGVAFNRVGIIRSVSVSHQPDGRKIISLQWEGEADATAIGAEAVTIRLPDASANAGMVDGTSYVTFPTYDATTGLLDISADPFAPTTYTYEPPTYPETAPTVYAIAWSTTLQVTTEASQSSPTWNSLHAPAGESVASAIHSSNSPYLSDTTTVLYLWSLSSDGGLYYSADALGTPAWALKQALTDYQLLRHVSGVSGGQSIAAYSNHVTTSWTKTWDFTSTDGTSDGWAAVTGSYSASNGWTDGAKVGFDQASIDNYVPIYFGMTITGLELKGNYTGASNDTGIYAPDLESEPNNNNTGSPFTVTRTSLSLTDTADTVRIYAYLNVPTGQTAYITEVSISGTGQNPWAGDSVSRVYSADNGDTIDIDSVAAVKGDQGADPDDYDLGIHMVAANNNVYYSTTYTGAFSAMAAMTGIDGTARVTVVRCPYLKLATQAANNSATSFQFIYGVDRSVSGATLWGVTFNSSTGAIATQSDMTPIIDSTTYYVVGMEALEASGTNTQVILAFAKPDGGGDTVLLYTADGGTTWEVRNTSFDGDFVRWVTGSTTKAWVSGADGIGYTANAGLTISSRTGDFSGTALGAYQP